MLQVLLYGVAAGLTTLVGGVITLVWRQTGRRQLALLLGLAAGVMLGVVVLDLLPAALRHGDMVTVAFGLSVGIFFLIVLERALGTSAGTLALERKARHYIAMGYLIAAGIALHDLPEGIVIAAGYEAARELGPALTVAIALHNIPEGVAMSAPLKMGGMRPAHILGLAALVSIFTPLGTLIGIVILGINQGLISFLLAGAAGAMTFVVGVELFPEMRKLSARWGAAGLLWGALVAIVLGFWD